MKKRLVVMSVLVLSIFLGLGDAEAGVRQPGKIGLGFGAGTMATGLSGKYFMDSQTSIQANLGWWRERYYCGRYHCYGGGESLSLSADFLLEMPKLAGDHRVTLAWEVGAGAGLGFNSSYADNFGLGISGVVGIALLLDVIPIDLVIEYRPGFYVVPGFAFDLVNFTGHIRFFF